MNPSYDPLPSGGVLNTSSNDAYHLWSSFPECSQLQYALSLPGGLQQIADLENESAVSSIIPPPAVDSFRVRPIGLGENAPNWLDHAESLLTCPRVAEAEPVTATAASQALFSSLPSFSSKSQTPSSSALPFSNPAHAGALSAELQEMRREMVAIDLTLSFSGGATIRCHRVVLAASSAFFRSMFAENASSDSTIQINDTSIAVVEKLVNYAYTGRIDVVREELTELTNATEVLGFREVKSICLVAAEKFRYRDSAKKPSASPEGLKVVETTQRKPSLTRTPLYSRNEDSCSDLKSLKKRKKPVAKLTDSKVDVDLVEALAVVLCEFERKLPLRAANTFRKWQEQPDIRKEITCGLCGGFIIGTFVDYAQHIWEERQVHDQCNIKSSNVDNKLPDSRYEAEGLSSASEEVLASSSAISDVRCERRKESKPLAMNNDLGLHKCSMCDEIFVSEKLRDRHLLNRHPPKNEVEERESQRKCQICDKEFRSRYTMKQHMARVHDGLREPKKPCPECKKLYSSAGLRAHRARDHAGVRKRCVDCPDDGSGSNLFMDAVALWTHRQRYHSEKKFRCTICSKDFVLKSAWKTHYDVKHGGKRWNCGKCKKSFLSNHALKRHHAHIHKWESHSCQKCGKSYSQASKLASHERKYHGDFPLICKFCGKGFVSENHHQTHLASKHGDAQEPASRCL